MERDREKRQRKTKENGQERATESKKDEEGIIQRKEKEETKEDHERQRGWASENK